MVSGLRVALIHDWLVTWGGSERVLQTFADLFPDAPIFVSVWDPHPRVREVFGKRDIRTTWLQRIPSAMLSHRALLPLMPAAFEGLDLSEFDLVISDSHAFSKAVRVREDAVHLCYCHTPPRYLWDLQSDYMGIGPRVLLSPMLRWLRRADRKAARRVTHFVANSRFVSDRIQRLYGRAADVLHPPVDVEEFSSLQTEQGEYFLAGGRLVPYKRIDVVIRAANEGGFPLAVFGDGPEREKLQGLAGPTVRFLGWLEPRGIARVIARSKAFLFAGVEDFGILPVEVQAVGKPVIAFRCGGLTETVRHLETGLLVEEPTPEAFVEAVCRFEREPFSENLIRENAKRFSERGFVRAFSSLLAEKVNGVRPRSNLSLATRAS